MDINNNLILDTDSYKPSHPVQYPPGTNAMFNYVAARKGIFPETMFFGLQMSIDKYFRTPVTEFDVMQADLFFNKHGLPFDRKGWMHIVNKHRGFMPVEIRAVREGMVIPNGLPMMTVESLDPEVFWIGSHLETMLLRVWYPCTVATISHYAKRLIRQYMLETCDNLDGLPFKLHDFGSRGVSSKESAGIGGAAHLVNFMGSDNIEGIRAANFHYQCDMAGFSIPAGEHSAYTAWGREHEVDAYRNMLRQFGKPEKMFAAVSDSYDIFNACENLWGGELRQEVIDSGATLVIRPDSGDPSTVVRQVAEILDSKFGSTPNSKGYKVLNHVRIIQGDGIDMGEIKRILDILKTGGFSADNIAFGMGGGLLQKCDRDTQSFAMKCSAVRVGNEWRGVAKDPITSPGKRSKEGRLTLMHDAEEGYYAVDMLKGNPHAGFCDSKYEALETVYRPDFPITVGDFNQVRQRADSHLSMPFMMKGM